MGDVMQARPAWIRLNPAGLRDDEIWDQHRDRELKALLRSALRPVLEGGASEIWVDLTGVRVMEAVILGVFVGARKQLEDEGEGRRIYLVNADGHPAEKLATTGLDRFFKPPPGAVPPTA